MSFAVTIVPFGTASLQFRVTLAGTPAKVGGVTSPTLIVCEAVEVLPQASVAVHTLTNVYEPAHEPDCFVSVKVIFGLGSQLSVAVGEPTLGSAPPQLAVTLVGTLVITGGALSPTDINCEAVVELPQASVAVQTRVMVYEPEHKPRVI